MTYPPGTLGILAGDLSRYSCFHQSVMALQLPHNTQILYVTGMWVAAAVNRIIRNMENDSEFLLLLSDDHMFEPDLLLRLLAHNVDIVAPLCCLRSPPFSPSIFHDTDGVYRGYSWEDLSGKSGLLPVPTMGGPGVLIRRRVLEAIGDPWFQCEANEHPNEDLGFFRTARLAGFQPYTDLDTIIGHATTTVLYPQKIAGDAWGIRLWNHRDIAVLPAWESQLSGIGFSEAK